MKYRATIYKLSATRIAIDAFAFEEDGELAARISRAFPSNTGADLQLLAESLMSSIGCEDATGSPVEDMR